MALSLDDEVTHSLSMESCNGESKDLMEAVKEGRRAWSPANESEGGRRGGRGLKRRGMGQGKTQGRTQSMFCKAPLRHRPHTAA